MPQANTKIGGKILNLIMCDENCRWQKEGYCTLDDLTSLGGGAESLCRHFEKRLQ